MADKNEGKKPKGYLRRALGHLNSSEVLPFMSNNNHGNNHGNSAISSPAKKASSQRTPVGRTRSGHLLPAMFQISVKDKRGATAKRRYQVQVPTKMLRYVCIVFLALPALLFVYSELHVHDAPKASYRSERTHVDPKEVFSQLQVGGNSTLGWNGTMAGFSTSADSSDPEDETDTSHDDKSGQGNQTQHSKSPKIHNIDDNDEKISTHHSKSNTTKEPTESERR